MILKNSSFVPCKEGVTGSFCNYQIYACFLGIRTHFFRNASRPFTFTIWVLFSDFFSPPFSKLIQINIDYYWPEQGRIQRLQRQNKSCLYVFRWEKFHILNQFSLIAIFMLNKSIYIFIDFILNLRNTNFKTTDKKQFYPRL